MNAPLIISVQIIETPNMKEQYSGMIKTNIKWPIKKLFYQKRRFMRFVFK